MSLLPRQFEGLDPFPNLKEWAMNGPEEHRRHWSVFQWERDKVVCELSWNLDGQCAGVRVTAMTGPEAIWLALEEYAAREKLLGVFGKERNLVEDES